MYTSSMKGCDFMYKAKSDNEYYYKSLPSDGRLNIKLPVELHNEVKAKAESEGITLSVAIKNLLIKYILNEI
jgi:predicted DNA binding CopG/RHH family protein